MWCGPLTPRLFDPLLPELAYPDAAGAVRAGSLTGDRGGLNWGECRRTRRREVVRRLFGVRTGAERPVGPFRSRGWSGLVATIAACALSCWRRRSTRASHPRTIRALSSFFVLTMFSWPERAAPPGSPRTARRRSRRPSGSPAPTASASSNPHRTSSACRPFRLSRTPCCPRAWP